jgi:hypothetical protein
MAPLRPASTTSPGAPACNVSRSDGEKKGIVMRRGALPPAGTAMVAAALVWASGQRLAFPVSILLGVCVCVRVEGRGGRGKRPRHPHEQSFPACCCTHFPEYAKRSEANRARKQATRPFLSHPPSAQLAMGHWVRFDPGCICQQPGCQILTSAPMLPGDWARAVAKSRTSPAASVPACISPDARRRALHGAREAGLVYRDLRHRARLPGRSSGIPNDDNAMHAAAADADWSGRDIGRNHDESVPSDPDPAEPFAPPPLLLLLLVG